jgi:hypothetical protein
MIKNILLTLALVFAVTASFAGCTDDVSTSDAPSQISTRSDLDAYLGAEPSDSPLRAFTPAARERFLADVTFSDVGGVSSYYFGDVEKLNADQAHALLRLFNVESTLGIRNDDGMAGYRCVARATCQWAGAGYVCLASC